MQNASADPTVSGGLDEAIILSTADPRLAKDIKDNERPKIPMTSNLGDDCPPASAGFPAVDSLASPQTTYKYGPMGSRSKRRISTTGELSEDDERIAIVNHDPNYDQDEDESELQDRDDAQRGFREAPPASIGYPPVDGIARRFDRHPDFPDLDSSDDESSKLTSNNQNTSRQPPEEPPSLTMSIFNSGGSVVPFRHRMLSILASMGINLVLPFINGVMLGECLGVDANFFRFA